MNAKRARPDVPSLFAALDSPQAKRDRIVGCQNLAKWVVKKFGPPRRSVSREDWQDLVGACLLGIVEAAEEFDPLLGIQFSTFATWKARKRLSGAMNDLRRKGFYFAPPVVRRPVRFARVNGKLVPAVELVADRPTGEGRTTVRWDAVFKTLSPSQRKVIRLRRAGVPANEIASRVGMSDAAVRSLTRAAKRRLRELGIDRFTGEAC